MTNTSAHGYLAPFMIMVLLMSLVGLITSLNQQFQAPMQAAYLIESGNLTNTLTTLLNFAFFLAYFVMGRPVAKYIDKYGYRRTLITGLLILIVGFGLYMLSAFVFDTHDAPHFATTLDEARRAGEGYKYVGEVHVPAAYYLFLLAAFVAGSAMTFLQAVINPYLVACEVPNTSGVQRQNIGGTGFSLMTTLAPLFVAVVIFQGRKGLEIDITSLYLPIAALMTVVGLVALALTRSHLPEVIAKKKSEGEPLPESIWSFRHLRLGVFALFCSMGAEVAIGANINLFALAKGYSITTAATMATIYWSGMLIGRFFGSFLNRISASTQLKVGAIGAIALLGICIVTDNPWILTGIGLCHSVMWGSIFALALDGLGRYTSQGSGALMMGLFGGALIPFAQASLVDLLGSWTPSLMIVLLAEAYLLFYAQQGHKVLKKDTAR